MAPDAIERRLAAVMAADVNARLQPYRDAAALAPIVDDLKRAGLPQ